MIPSGAISASSRPSAAASRTSPAWNVIAVSRAGARRASPWTMCPRSTRVRATTGPANPDAPVTRMRMVAPRSAARSGCRQTVFVHGAIVLAVGAALDRLPPRSMRAIPGDRVGDTLLERPARRPAGGSQPAGIERVATVVAGPVGHVPHQVARPPGEVEDDVGDGAVGTLVRGAHVPHPPVRLREVEHVPERGAVIAHVDPVAHVLPVSVEWERLPVEGVGDEERDQLFGKLVGTVVVRTSRDDRRYAEGGGVGLDERIGSGLARGVGARGVRGPVLGGVSLGDAAVDLVG